MIHKGSGTTGMGTVRNFLGKIVRKERGKTPEVCGDTPPGRVAPGWKTAKRERKRYGRRKPTATCHHP